MASSSYAPTFPTDSVVDEKVKNYIANFYATSDDPSKNEEWVEYFLPDAVLIMGDKSVKGTNEIRRLRQGMWEQIASRRHRPEKVFPVAFGVGKSGDDIATEYMLHGSLDLVTKNGDNQTVSWAGRAVLKEVDGKLKYKLYQVYLHELST